MPSSSRGGPAGGGPTGNGPSARRRRATTGPSRPSAARSSRVGSRPVAAREASGRPGGSTRPATAPAGGPPGTGARRSGRRVSAGGDATPRPESSQRRSPLVRQILVLGLVLCTVALVLAFPLRTYLAGRARLSAETQTEQKLQQDLDALIARKAALQDPNFIKQEARRRLQYVSPGDTVYMISLPTPALLSDQQPAAAHPGAAAPWYSHLWDTMTDTRSATTISGTDARGTIPRVAPTSSTSSSMSSAPATPSAPSAKGTRVAPTTPAKTPAAAGTTASGESTSSSR